MINMVYTSKGVLKVLNRTLNRCGSDIAGYKNVLYPFKNEALEKEFDEFLKAQQKLKLFIQPLIE